MSDIKLCFTSRYGEDGCIINADFSQLEVMVLAHLSKDPTLVNDLITGVDMHRRNAASMLRKKEADVTDHERKLAKAFSFQLNYGAGAKSMAESNGVPVKVAQAFIDAYYSRYPLVKEWQDRMIEHVKLNRTITADKSPAGFPLGRSQIRSETGRIYTFWEKDNPYFREKHRFGSKPKPTNFSPTEIKNHPVQGLATGDIVPMMLGKVYRWLLTGGWIDKGVLLVNTVHDSMMLDTPKELVYTIGVELKRVLERTGEVYRTQFGVPYNLPFRVDVTAGPSWHESQQWPISDFKPGEL